jgi:hypothetical protein
MPDIPATMLMLGDEPLVSLSVAARITGRPLRVVQSWTVPGPKGEPPVLPVARQDDTGLRRKWVRLIDLRATADRRRWGNKRTKKRRLTTKAGRTIEIQGQAATPSRLPE